MTLRDCWRSVLVLLGVAMLVESAAAAPLPLQPTRTIKFSTDEGTWISLDVAPSGKSIVFELLGDLYTLPIAGGKARRITSGMAFDSQPRFSPDGKTLVFVSDRDGAENLWLVDADGANPRAVTSSKGDMYMSPEWTLDGDSIVVTRSIGSASGWAWARETRDLSLYIYHRDGGAGVKFTSLSPPGQTGAAFGNDPDVLFAAVSSDSTDAEHGLWQIVSFDRRRATSVLLTDEPGGAMRPLVSPDGRYLIYASRRDDVTQLRVRDQHTGDTRTLLDNVTRDAQRDPDIGRDLMPGSAFLPDGKSFVTSIGGKLWRVSVPGGEVTAIPFTAEVEQGLGPLLHFDQAVDDTVTVREIRNAKPSPDGTQLVFSALDRLWLMDLPNGKPRRLTSDDSGEFFPTWSPDGRFIAFATWSELDGGTIKRIQPRVGATAETLVSDTAYYYEKLAYSPDGRSLYAARSSHRSRADALNEMSMWRDISPVPLNTELIRLRSEGGAFQSVLQLTAGKVYAPFHGVPHFNRASGSMYLYEYDRGLTIVGDPLKVASKSRRPLLTVTGWDEAGGTNQMQEPADDLVISPDGTRALALVNQDLHLIDLPAVAGAQPPVISVDDGSPSPLPIRRITRADGAGPGGDFAGWFPDGQRVYYSLGSTFYIYELASRRTRRVDVILTVPRDRPSGAVLLRGARLITMKGREVIEDGDLLVVDNRIRAVGARGKVSIPEGARVIDVTGKTIMPGLIDVHAHLWPIWDAHRKTSWEYAASLAYGVTSVRDPQSKRSDALTYADRIDAGDMIGARVFSVGRGVFAQVGLRSLADTRQVLRRYSEHYRTHTIKQYLVGGRLERQWFAMAAKEQGLTPTTEGGKDFKMNLTLVLDGYSGLEHWIDTTPLYRDVTELMARSGIAYTLTTNVELDYFYRRNSIHDDAKLRRFMPHSFIDRLPYRARSIGIDDPYLFERHAADAAKIVAAGGRVALGSHGNFPGWGVHWELWANQSGGMSPHDALRIGTLAGAEAIGLGRQLGSLEAGKIADLLVLDANPLLDIRATLGIRYVMKNGRVYESDTLREIWPRVREFGLQSWMSEPAAERSETVH